MPLQYSCLGESPKDRRRLVDFSPWDHKDMTEQLSIQAHRYIYRDTDVWKDTDMCMLMPASVCVCCVHITREEANQMPVHCLYHKSDLQIMWFVFEKIYMCSLTKQNKILNLIE